MGRSKKESGDRRPKLDVVLRNFHFDEADVNHVTKKDVAEIISCLKKEAGLIADQQKKRDFWMEYGDKFKDYAETVDEVLMVLNFFQLASYCYNEAIISGALDANMKQVELIEVAEKHNIKTIDAQMLTPAIYLARKTQYLLNILKNKALLLEQGLEYQDLIVMAKEKLSAIMPINQEARNELLSTMRGLGMAGDILPLINILRSISTTQLEKKNEAHVVSRMVVK